MLSKRKIKGQSKENDPALRHKVRNLRAKVRLLLPMSLCCKQQKRSKNLLKLTYSKLMQQQEQTKRWCNWQEDTAQLFIPHEQGRQQKHLFHKLTNEEIQQIKEDKMYYLGQEFISEFDLFLQSKEKMPHHKAAGIMENSKHPIMSIQEAELKNWNWHKNRSGNLASQPVEKIDWNSSQLIKLEGIKQKRKLLYQQDVTKRVFLKMKLREKQERMRNNQQKVFQAKMQAIVSKNKVIDTKSSQSIVTNRNYNQHGEITDLSQKLREICLSRASKSANLLFRN